MISTQSQESILQAPVSSPVCEERETDRATFLLMSHRPKKYYVVVGMYDTYMIRYTTFTMALVPFYNQRQSIVCIAGTHVLAIRNAVY